MCLEHFTGTESRGADGMCTVFKRDLTPFPTDGVIKAYMLFRGWKKKWVSREPRSGLEALWARCEGPTEGAWPQPGRPRKPQHDWGSANWPQIPPELWEDGKTEWQCEEKKVRSCRLQRAAGTTIYNDGSGPRREPALVKCAQTGMHVCIFSPLLLSTKELKDGFLFMKESKTVLWGGY